MASVGTIKYKNGSTWVDILHPVGSFYLSTNSTSPSSLFGGTWVQITNAVLRGATNFGYTGNDSTTLSLSQIPQHNHSFWGYMTEKEASGYGLNGSSDFQNRVLVYVDADQTGFVGRMSTGGSIVTETGQAHTNIQRSLNCFIWYRTA